MFTDFFFLLRFYGVPVTVTEWLALMRGLAMGLVPSGLDEFYAVARSILVKSEAYFDQYDQAFAAMFKGIETPVEIDDEVWDWLSDPLTMPGLSDEERRLLAAALEDLDLEALQRMFEERLKEQTEAHHGGNKWVGTGGTSPFGHSGLPPRRHPRGRREPQPDRRQGGRRAPLPRLPHRPGGRRAAVRARPPAPSPARARATKACPTSSTSTRPSRRRRATPAASASSGARAARTPSRCCCSWTSAAPCTPTSASAASSSAPWTAARHFKDLRIYYFHNCVYDWLYTSTRMTSSEAISTRRVLQELPSDYKLIIVGDAAMAPSELMARDGIIWWGYGNDEPGIEWLKRLRRHFDHSVWLNTIPETDWDRAYGSVTIRKVREVFPMFELTVDGLTAATRKLMVRY